MNMTLQQFVADLLEVGLTQVEIAAKCDCAQSTVSAIYRGENKNPGYELGRQIEVLWRKHQSKRRKVAA
jgi:hypothetical protein